MKVETTVRPKPESEVSESAGCILPNASHVQFQGLTDADDREIWEFAIAERSRLYGSPPKVIWLRCGNTPTSNVEAILRSGAEAIQELIDSATLDCLELY
ncbi:hypothetical protein MiSe_80670 [Microseira wollei NIES-4236]|uniref:DUF5615 domain-containing protein n=1 Tax=Microseira wollei NIES-4236 TaxID=2530354 RepID=A0AAV3XQ29_9CYAN|nr:DUF5615 family PIN-like protein [Microseira wollei]GET43245.1 hypothetical protein MiSe_80670 [Microseira wollei NIES-4236]